MWVTPHQRVPFSPCKTTIRGIEAVLEEFQHPRLPNFNFPIPPKVSIQIASNKWYKGENIFYLDQNQIDELKNSKENKSGVRLEITPKQIKKKEGGFLPLILSCLEAAAVATPDIVALYDSYRDSKHKKKIKEKTIRHNKEMEKNKGSGLKKANKKKKIEKINCFEIEKFRKNIKNFKGVYTVFRGKEK